MDGLRCERKNGDEAGSGERNEWRRPRVTMSQALIKASDECRHTGSKLSVEKWI